VAAAKEALAAHTLDDDIGDYRADHGHDDADHDLRHPAFHGPPSAPARHGKVGQELSHIGGGIGTTIFKVTFPPALNTADRNPDRCTPVGNTIGEIINAGSFMFAG